MVRTGKRSIRAVCVVLGFLCLVSAGLLCLKLDRGYLKEQFATAVLALLIPCLTLLLLHRSGADKEELAILLFPVGAALFLRMLLLDHVDPDYSNFLHPWFLSYQEMGGISAVAENITNYNLPYQYFLALISYIPLPDLYMIKLFSVLFDFILAWGGYRIARALDESPGHARAMAAFSVLLFLPAVLLNSSYWGQCDSVYSAFCLHAVASALSGRHRQSAALIALALSFKLQAVFLLPFWGILLVCGKARLQDLGVFVSVFLLILLPALIIGKPLPDILRIYLDQSGQYAALSLRAPSVFQFLPADIVSSGNPVLAASGIILAGLSVLGLLALAFRFRKTLSPLSLLAFSAALSIAVPFFLPHMHERYFYLAECTAAVLAAVCSRAVPASVLVSGASLASYVSYFRRQSVGALTIGKRVYEMIPEACAVLLALVSVLLILRKDLLSCSGPNCRIRGDSPAFFESENV